MEPLAKRLGDARQSGIYQLIGGSEEVERAAKEAGLGIFPIDVAGAQDKDTFLALIAKALSFPPWFGNNWDALADCLRDLEWLNVEKGCVLVFENVDRFATQHPNEFETSKQVFETAAEHWRTNGTPFWIFIAGNQF